MLESLSVNAHVYVLILYHIIYLLGILQQHPIHLYATEQIFTAQVANIHKQQVNCVTSK